MGSCFINHTESVVVACIVPLSISVILCMVLFTFATVLLCCASRSQAELGRGSTISYSRIHCAVFSVAGLTWLFGFIAILAGTNLWIWYLFIVLNSLQGFTIIFVAFLCIKKVLMLYVSALKCKKKTSSGTAIA